MATTTIDKLSELLSLTPGSDFIPVMSGGKTKKVSIQSIIDKTHDTFRVLGDDNVKYILEVVNGELRAVPEEKPSETEDPLATLKKNQILLSKKNLAKYLEEHPLFSTCKYEEGRYYNVTAEKQQQLTSKVLMATMYAQIGMPYNLTWNDTGMYVRVGNCHSYKDYLWK
ncbi:MAG: hypothetical protein ACLS95_08135 [Clostridia bacterium]